MSKGDGLKIGIKFTEDLVGDVSGNEPAFAITGQEYKYVGGPLIDKQYVVGKIERYPVQRLWNLGRNLQLDKEGQDILGSNGINSHSDFTLGNQPANRVYGWAFTPNENIEIDKLRIYPNKTKTYKVDLWDALTQNKVASANIICVQAQWNEQAITPVSLVGGREYRISFDYTGGDNQYNAHVGTIGFDTKITYKYAVYAAGNDIYPFSTWADALYGIVDIGIAGVQAEYVSSKTETTNQLQLTGDYRVNWQENKPIDTDIVIEYTTGEIQGQWQEVSNGDILTSDTNLWIRATLSTEDTAITPILQDLWLEEADAPQDKILLTMDWWGKFNNAEGELTVNYDAAKGSLTGAGGAVESFEVEFTPTDLVQTPNPHVVEYLKAYPYKINLDFKEIDRQNRYAEEHLKAYPYEIVLDLKHVSEINP